MLLLAAEVTSDKQYTCCPGLYMVYGFIITIIITIRPCLACVQLAA